MEVVNTYPAQEMRMRSAVHMAEYSRKAAQENIMDLVRHTSELVTSKNFKFSPEEAKVQCEEVRQMISALREVETTIKQSQ